MTGGHRSDALTHSLTRSLTHSLTRSLTHSLAHSQLRTKFKINGCIYRIFPSGEVQYLHPKDGVYPEKVNKGREAVNTNDRSIGQNVNPIKVKFTGKNAYEL